MSTRRVRVLAERLPKVVAMLTSRRRGPGPHWVMVVEVEAFLARHEIEVTLNELVAGIDLAVDRQQLRAQGEPPHSVAVFEPPRQWLGD
jgi:hypothetical protein